MYKKLFLFIAISLFVTACEKKSPVSEPTEKSVTKKESSKVQESEDDEKLKLVKEKSQTNPNKYKLNLILVTQVGCGACEKVKEYMKEEDVKTFLDKDFIVQEVDINFKEELPFSWMEPYATPTLYFLDDKNEEIIDTVVMRLTKKQLTDRLKEALDIRNMD